MRIHSYFDNVMKKFIINNWTDACKTHVNLLYFFIRASNNHFGTETERSNPFLDYMFANRKFHGCPAALLTLTEDWRAELDKRKVIGAVAIDLSKAFDCLPIELLLEKLKFYGVSDNSVALLRSYLSCRYQ